MSALELYKNGTIKQLCNQGFISPDMLSYFEYYEYYLGQRKVSGYCEAIMMTALNFKRSESTIARAVRILSKS